MSAKMIRSAAQQYHQEQSFPQTALTRETDEFGGNPDRDPKELAEEPLLNEGPLRSAIRSA